MEYKLSKSEFYRVGFLLSGLFMFLFLFGILSLSSYAVSPSTRTLSLSPSESYSETYGTYFYSYDLNDYSNPVTTITTSTGGSGYTQNNYNGTVRGSNAVHLVTSEGDFVVNINQGLADVNTRTVTVVGVPQRVYATFDAYNNQSSAVNTYATFTVNSISVSNGSNSGLVGGGTFSDYSSYSLVNCDTSLLFNSDYNDINIPAGSVISYTVDDINTTNANFLSNGYINFSSRGDNKYLVRFSVRASTNNSANLGTGFYLVFNFDNQNYFSAVSDMQVFPYCVYPNGDYGFIYSATFDFPFTETNVRSHVGLLGSYAIPIKSFSFSVSKYKGTIADYMQYVKDNWDTISPAVSDTNQNIAQSVSDIGTAQTFESSAFSDFDSSMTSSGLDSFSLSFASIPLLWCASIINTFYNNMPSGFQYLLMFVAFVGILVIVLNIAGRVVRRFGGD